MPIITGAPILVDPVNFSRPSGSYEQPPYEFKVGTDIYLVFANKQIPVTHIISVYRSTDNGTTWAAQDDAGAPVTSSSFVCFKEAGGTIDVCYTTGGAFKIVQFDTGTNLWGTPTAAASVGENQFYFYRQTGGNYVVIFNHSSHIAYIKYSAGVWDAGATNLVAVNDGIFGGDVTSADVAFVFAAPNAGGSAALYRIDAAMAVTGPFALTDPWANNTRPTVKLWSTDSVAVAQVPSSGGADVVVEIGTPLSSPVMTRYPIYTKAVTEVITYATLIPNKDAALTVNYVRVDYTTSPLVDEVDQSTFDGASTWAAPIVFYDEITNPPANSVPDQLHQFVHTIDGMQLADGSWVMAVSMETEDAAVQHCTGFILRSSSGTPTKTLYTWPPILLGSPTPPPGTFSAGCPSPIYIVGTPYDSFVVVTGGTGPYTFAVTSGSLPTGLSLNASTGEITGTPSAAGPFSFKITVTDSTGATAVTGTCSAGRCPGTRSII